METTAPGNKAQEGRFH